MKTFSERLKKLRTEKGLTQRDVAIVLGISPRNYWRYENGKNKPSSEVMAKLSNLLNVSTNYLLGIDEDYNSERSRLLTAFEKLNADNKRTLLEIADFLNAKQKFSATNV